MLNEIKNAVKAGTCLLRFVGLLVEDENGVLRELNIPGYERVPLINGAVRFPEASFGFTAHAVGFFMTDNRDEPASIVRRLSPTNIAQGNEVKTFPLARTRVSQPA